MDDEEITKKVLAKFNTILGDDIENLTKCYDIHEELLKEKTTLENTLSLANSEAPSKMKKAVEKVEAASRVLNEKEVEAMSLLESVKSSLDENSEISEALSDKMEKIRILKCAIEYLNIVEDIENISRELETALQNNEDARIIQLFISLRGSGNDQGIGGRLQDCQAPHLQQFAKDTIKFWHDLLKDKFGKEFEECLKLIKWPFVGANVSATGSPSAENISKFQLLVEYLLQIQIENGKKCSEQDLVSDFVPLCLPMSLLIKPLRKRFLFHFYGTKQTNRLDKPEWYLTQILTWIRDHEQFIETKVQPVLDRTGYGHTDTKLDFMRGLVFLAIEKLYTDLDRLVNTEELFTHLIDECLGFSRELSKDLEYPTGQPSVLAVLTQAQYFVKWLSMEKKYATEKVDAMLSGTEAWEPLDPRGDDILQITQLADSFLMLLTAVQERYSTLPQPGHRLQFLDLQLELIDDFRVRLIQLLHEQPDDESLSRVPQILNTVNYVASVLTEWGSNIHYLQLHHFKCQMNDMSNSLDSENSTRSDPLNCSVFDGAIELLNRFCAEHITALSEMIMLGAKAKSWSYRKDKWFAMPGPLPKEEMSLSQTACQMFQVLSARLHKAQSRLAIPLFDSVWQQVAELLDVFLYEELILQNNFNAGGAAQLQFDVHRNLFPLFAQYTKMPETVFQRTHESCKLLNLAKGSALLLLESLNDRTMIKESDTALKELKIIHLDANASKEILKKRLDLTLE